MTDTSTPMAGSGTSSPGPATRVAQYPSGRQHLIYGTMSSGTVIALCGWVVMHPVYGELTGIACVDCDRMAQAEGAGE